MANIYEYLDWRGDLNFYQSPLNDIDALILSYISYTNFTDIINNDIDKRISIYKASKQIFEKYTEEELLDKVSITKMSPFLLKKIANTNRFKNLKLFNFVNEINVLEESQFSAISIDLGNSIFVSFRGTDETLIGWKENFNMLFLDETPGQKKALEYLNSLKELNIPIYIGGHSKGGNLSIYAASKANKELKNRIINVYSFDGLGFKDYKYNKNIREIDNKIKLFLPEFCIVGKIFDNKKKFKIIKSSQKGILQHDALSWEVSYNDFLICKNFAKQDDFLIDSFSNIYKDLSEDELKDFINAIYKILDDLDIKKVDDFNDINFNTLQEFLKVKNNLNSKYKKLITETFKLLLTYIINPNLDKK